MIDVVALGELLIDFTPGGTSQNGSLLFERNPGGAPANVLATVAKLGGSTAFIGKVGNDQFGNFLKHVLIDVGISTKGLVFSDDTNTTLAFVHLDDKGDRTFSFYRKPGADMMLSRDDVDVSLIQNARIFHFGSVSMTHEPSRTATLYAAEYAKEKGVTVSYDPNLRPPLWEDLNQARESILQGMQYTDILKISEEELEFLTDTDNLEEGSQFLANEYELPLVFVTLGPDGCFYRYKEKFGHIPGYSVNAIDTTGAGDAFMGSILYQFVKREQKLHEISINQLEDMIKYANGVGALITTKRGAIPAIPNKQEIDDFLS